MKAGKWHTDDTAQEYRAGGRGLRRAEASSVRDR